MDERRRRRRRIRGLEGREKACLVGGRGKVRFLSPPSSSFFDSSSGDRLLAWLSDNGFNLRRPKKPPTLKTGLRIFANNVLALDLPGILLNSAPSALTQECGSTQCDDLFL